MCPRLHPPAPPPAWCRHRPEGVRSLLLITVAWVGWQAEIQTKVRENFTITILKAALNVKVLSAFNQDKALVGAFYVIVKSLRTFV